MPTMTRCPECEHRPLSRSARQCPRCGAKLGGGPWKTLRVAGAIGAVVSVPVLAVVPPLGVVGLCGSLLVFAAGRMGGDAG